MPAATFTAVVGVQRTASYQLQCRRRRPITLGHMPPPSPATPRPAADRPRHRRRCIHSRQAGFGNGATNGRIAAMAITVATLTATAASTSSVVTMKLDLASATAASAVEAYPGKDCPDIEKDVNVKWCPPQLGFCTWTKAIRYFPVVAWLYEASNNNNCCPVDGGTFDPEHPANSIDATFDLSRCANVAGARSVPVLRASRPHRQWLPVCQPAAGSS